VQWCDVATKRAPLDITCNVYQKTLFVRNAAPSFSAVPCRFVPYSGVISRTASPVPAIGYVTSDLFLNVNLLWVTGSTLRYTTLNNYLVELSTSPGVYREIVQVDNLTDFFTFAYYRWWIYSSQFDV